MKTKTKDTAFIQETTAKTVRSRIDACGERVWRLSDFADLSPSAVAQTLSRLSRQGAIQRLGKGLYYRSRPTVFGPSQPNWSQIQELPLCQKGVFPAGVSAANLLGFTTQNSAQVEVATNASSLPRQIVGKSDIVHTRRPNSWKDLTREDAALLDFLRNRGSTSELSPEETVLRLIAIVKEQNRLERLLKIAQSEPPRVRAMLGAIAEQLGYPVTQLKPLRDSLNPLSRFEFGLLASLKHAAKWQAKECKKVCFPPKSGYSLND